MRVALLLVIIAFPLLELALLIKVGQWIGFWWTMLILIGAALGGIAVLREQGFAAARRMMQASREGRPPIEPVVESVFLMMAGILLLVPGLISDAIGCLLLIPPLRRAIARWALTGMFSNARFHFESRTFGDTTAHHRPGSGRDGHDGGVVIEGEWERVDQPEKNRSDTSNGAIESRRDAGGNSDIRR